MRNKVHILSAETAPALDSTSVWKPVGVAYHQRSLVFIAVLGPPGRCPTAHLPSPAFTMGFLSCLWCGSTNDPVETETEVEKQSVPSEERDAASATGFFSNFCSISPDKRTDVEGQRKPRNKPPKYNRHNLPSMEIQDPPPWVTNHHKLKRQSDGTLFVTSLPQAQPKSPTSLDTR